MGHPALANKESRLVIAETIRQFLHKSGHSRKVLINRESHNLSESTVNKVFQGEFSERTLAMIEAILNCSFRSSTETCGENKEPNGYRLEVDNLQGTYLCVRP